MLSDYIPFIHVIVVLSIFVIVLRRSLQSRVIKFPKDFTLSYENSDKPIIALMKMSNIPEKNKIIRVDFSNVETLNEITYMLFLAQVEKANAQHKNVFLQGVLQSKSMDIIIRKKKFLHNYIDLRDEKIDALVHSSIQTKPIDEAVLGLKKIGIKEYYSPLYDLLIELVGNAIEHGINKTHNINWWLHQEMSPQKNSITYAFVDMGTGILESYRTSSFINRLKNSKHLIVDAFEGVLGSTTKQAGRGRGLPQITYMVKKGYISDFILITNNISLQYKNGGWKVKKNPNFNGTYYSWKVSKENFLTWKK